VLVILVVVVGPIELPTIEPSIEVKL